MKMALIKEIILPNGISTNYHRIAEIGKKDNTISVIVLSYVNQQYRELSTDNQVKSEIYSFYATEDNISFNSIYQLLKTIDPFIESIDA